MSKGQRLTFVDGLRGVAASLVVVDHFYHRVAPGLWLPMPISWIFLNGYLGVAIFFVLSGFVISMSVGERGISAEFLGRFALRRAVRLDPPYWTSIIAALGLAVVATRLFGIEKTFPSPQEVAAHLFYLQDLLGYENIIAVYWTLCLEVQFYLFLIVLLWAIQSAYGSGSTSRIIGRPAAQAVVGVLLILSLLQFTSIVQIVPKGTFLPYWFCFTLGAMTYWVLARWVPVTYLAVLASLVLVAGVVFGNPWCMTAVLTATLLYTAGRAGTMATWLSGRGIQFLGRISYSLYLFHAIVGWSAMSVALRYLPQQMNAWQSAGAGVVGIVFSIMSASVVYLLVERFSVRLSHKISLEPAPMAMAQAATETI